MVRRLMRDGHDCVVYARSEESLRPFVEDGAKGVTSYEDLAAALEPPRALWIMVPAAAVGSVVDDVTPHLQPGDMSSTVETATTATTSRERSASSSSASTCSTWERRAECSGSSVATA